MDYNEAIKNSHCFGVAYDAAVKECKLCEVSKLCKARTEGTPAQDAGAKVNATVAAAPDTDTTPAQPRPQPKTAEAAPAPAPKAPKAPKASKPASSKQYDPDMPDFKPMEMDDLVKLASDRGVDVKQFDKFTETKIKRMRIIMALKATYEVK